MLLTDWSQRELIIWKASSEIFASARTPSGLCLVDKEVRTPEGLNKHAASWSFTVKDAASGLKQVATKTQSTAIEHLFDLPWLVGHPLEARLRYIC